MSRRLEPTGLFGIALLGVVWSWWAWQEGGYFETVWMPGTIVLCAAGALLLLISAPPEARGPRGAALVALLALAGLGIWSLLSAIWSPAPETAVTDGQRILMYALAFGLGFWICRLLGARRALLALAPIAAAAAFAGAAAVITMLGAEDPDGLLANGTLDYPLGYRNANAAFFLIAVFPALGLAADARLDWRLRGPALATATMSLELAALSQSRASVPAAVAAVALYALISPLRARALCWLVLAALPALGFVPGLIDLFDVAKDDAGESRVTILAELEDTGMAITATTAIALFIGLLAARFERRLPGLGSTSGRWNRAVAAGLAILAAGAGGAFVVARGDPVEWIENRVDEFRFEGTPAISERSSRFTFNAGSNRYDLWRVALDDAASDPLLGSGGGGYQYSYLRQRNSDTEARDAHSVELEVLTELGAPGLLLLVAAVAAALIAALRARRAGPEAATLTAIALASATYWLLHASLDWFWTYAVVTAPVIALLGAAAAPVAESEGGKPGGRRPSRAGARLVAGVLVVLALTMVPPFLSGRYVDDAFAGWRSDLGRAYDDLERAHDLNPLSDLPFLAAGAIARASGDRERAVAALEEAIERKPEEFAGHFLLAALQADSDRAEARERIGTALELNPRDPQVRGLAEELGLRTPPLD